MRVFAHHDDARGSPQAGGQNTHHYSAVTGLDREELNLTLSCWRLPGLVVGTIIA
ncbi:MAG: hypothetical protein H6905_04020 [Hyphomicrobiales bacterium]|nr:hypothetical protein [Hyphomicrobiales bacterium]